MTIGKRIICLFLCLHIMLGLCSCGVDSSNSSDTPPTTKLVENSEEVSLFSSDTDTIGVTRLESKLFLLGIRRESPVLACADIQTDDSGKAKLSRATELLIQPPESEEWIAYTLTAGGDGNLYLLLGNKTESGASTELFIQQYGSDGSFLGEMIIADWPFLTVDSFGVGREQEIVVCADNVISVYYWQEVMLARHTLDDYYVQSVSLCDDGLVLSLLPRRVTSKEESPYYLIDPKTGTLDQIDFPVVDPSGDALGTLRRKSGSAVPCQGLHGEYLANQGDWIYCVDFDSGSFEKLIEWNAEEGVTQKLGSSCRLSDNYFVCVLNGRLILSWGEEMPVRKSGQAPVRVAAFDGTISQRLARTVKTVASHIPSYEYSIEVFNWDHRERVMVEIATGTWDLVIFHDEIDTGGRGFEDLYPFLDADPELSRESFVPHLLESLEDYGELHQLWNCTGVCTFVSSRSLIPDPYGLTLNDCEIIVNENKDIPSVFFQMYDVEENQQRLLGMVARTSVASFVDKERASCSFDCDEFRELLLWCSRVPPYQDTENSNQKLLDSRTICSAADIEKLEPYFEGEPVITGFPNGDNGFHYFALGYDYERSMAMAIPSAGKAKDGAWAFIREMLSESRQNAVAGGSAPSVMPVLYDVVKHRNESAEEKYRAMFFLMLENTYGVEHGDKELIDLIKTSCMPYLTGEKSLEDTIKIVQSRASIFVAEKYS